MPRSRESRSPQCLDIGVDETPFPFASGATQVIAGKVTALSAPEAGRELFGELSLRSVSGALLAKASVVIGTVTG